MLPDTQTPSPLHLLPISTPQNLPTLAAGEGGRMEQDPKAVLPVILLDEATSAQITEGASG